MTTVEVLAPVRLETRFVAPPDRTDAVAQWMLRVRVYPDEFSMRRAVPPPSPAELDRLTEAVAAMRQLPPIDEATAFASFASAVGAARALGLWRARVVSDSAGGFTVDRLGEMDPKRLQVHGPVGLPAQLEIWLIHADGTRQLGGTLSLDASAIADDLDLEALVTSNQLGPGQLPNTWWLSYQRAKDVGLGKDIDIGAAPPVLDALVVVGRGDTDAAELVDAHNAGSRLAVLAPGTPTNTVGGEATTDFGEHADSLFPLLHRDPKSQLSTSAVLTALTGRIPPAALPMLGGDLDYFAPGSLAVQGFWPVLWGRALRDVTTSDGQEIELARWAMRNLAVEGPRPAIRVGEQPYGLLPASAFSSWVADAADPLAPVEDRIRRWGLAWRAGASAAAEQMNSWVEGADSAGLLHVLGLHAPSRHWQVRPIADLVVVQVARAFAGMAPFPATDWDITTAGVWRRWPYPGFPIAPAAHPGQVPGPPGDEAEDPALLKALCTMGPEPLYFEGPGKLGLVGHLFREALISARAIAGEAITQWETTGRINLVASLPLDNEDTYRTFVMRGTDQSLATLETATDVNGRTIAARFREVQEALQMIADLWEPMHNALFRGTLAALDSAAFRVDPWLTGLAERRLQGMIARNSPFKLGAYGWVDAPAPFSGVGDELAPGPTAAGLLHAPSRDQALTAALLRDAAVRHPDDNRWQLTIDSSKVRASIALAERVRLGVHPYEALGLEVERVASDWDVVRVLRVNYALLPNQEARRVCDGAKVLKAAREGTLVAGLPADLATRLASLDEVLDTYADLLVADGIHSLVTGRADLGNAAMEAAAGLGAPPDLRSIRTPRAATTVRIAAWVLLPPGSVAGLGPDTAPALVADPGFVALVTSELGAAVLESSAPDVVAARHRLAIVLGGGEDEGPVPSLVGGAYEGIAATGDADLHAAMIADLDARLTRLRQLAQTVHDAVVALDPDDPGAEAAIGTQASRWGVDLTGVAPADPLATSASTTERRDALATALADRLSAAVTAVPVIPGGPSKTDAAVNLRCRAIRSLAGDFTLPVLPIIARSLLPTFRAAPDLDRTWLELVAAVRPRVAPLEARQLDPAHAPWPAVLAAPDGSTDPWHAKGPVVAAYGPAVSQAGNVAIVALDGWTDSIPSQRHVTSAAFGFNAPKSRAPQAILLAVPPDPAQRLTTGGLVDVVLETRQLAHARATRPGDRGGLPYATPAPIVHASPPVSFLQGWPA